MNTWFARFAASVALVAFTGTAFAQASQPAAVTSAPAPAPASSSAPLSNEQTAVQPATPSLSRSTAPAPQGLPNVESADILKQTQADRKVAQPGNLAPTYRVINEGTENYASIPALEAGVLIQPKTKFIGQSRETTAGEAWRLYRNGPLTVYGGWLIILVVLGIAAFFLVVGKIRVKEPKTGRLIERFTSVERITHWTVAISFLILAFTGLLMLFGKYILLPVFGHNLFGWLAYASKTIHNFIGPLFTVSLIVMFVIFVRDNLPRIADLQWLRMLGGARGHAHAGRFNAGEKAWFWGGVVLLGLIVSASGFVLDMLVPGILYTRGNMQIANVIHLIGAVLVFAASLGHIYIGTIGMEGAYDAMKTGYVDDAWAKEHHDLWYDEIQSGKVPRVRTQERVGDVNAPPVRAS